MSSTPVTAPTGINPAVPNLPYFTPAHASSPGTPLQLTPQTPTLFTPLKIRSKTLRNRIIVSPMCQYSAAPQGPDIGKLTDWHVATLGHYAIKGAALVFIEATGVQPNGRITPYCPGLWSDAQTESFKRVSDFVKSQGSLSGIQLGHAGRKASTVPPWITAQVKRPSMRATKETGGWPEDVVGPMNQDSWDGKGLVEDGGFYPPRQLSISEIQEIVKAYGQSARRAVEAGIDVIEIHGAHGFENRTRLLKEVIQAVRAEMPLGMPLFLRISSTEWMEKTELGQKYGSWDVQSTLELAKLLPSLGVDLLDASSGGNHPQQQIQMMASRDYQTKIASQIRHTIKQSGLKILVGAVGLINKAEQARDIVETADNSSIGEEAASAKEMIDAKEKEPMADVVFVARQFLREPEWVLKVAWQLGIEVAWPSQFWKVRFP